MKSALVVELALTTALPTHSGIGSHRINRERYMPAPNVQRPSITSQPGLSRLDAKRLNQVGPPWRCQGPGLVPHNLAAADAQHIHF